MILIKKKDNLSISEKILWAIFFVSAIFASALNLFNLFGIGEIYLFRILIIFFFVAYFRCFSKKTKLQKGTVYLFFGIIIYGALSLLWCTSKSAGIKALGNYVLVFMLLMVLISFFDSTKRLNFSLECCSVVLVLLQICGIIESLTGNYFFSVDDIWLQIRNEIGLWSPLTVFDNTNDFIFALVGYLPFFFISVNQMKRKNFVLQNSLKGLYVISTGYLAYAGQCRMGLISLVFMLFGYLYFGRLHRILKPIVIVSIIIMVCSLPWWFDIIKSEARWEIWGDALKSARHFSFLGVGIGNSYIKIPGIEYAATVVNPHFWVLENFVEFGFIVFGFVLVWYIYIIKQTSKLMHRYKNSYRLKSIMIFLISFVLMSMMSSTIAFSNMFYIFVCPVIGIITEFQRKESQKKIKANG